MKALTDRGLVEVDEIIDRTIEKPIAPQSPPEPLPPPARKAYIQKCNNDPNFSDNGIKAVPSGVYYALIAGFILFVILFGVAVIWANVSFSSKNFSPSVSVAPAQVSVPVEVQVNSTNEIYVQPNMTISLPKEFSDALIKVLNRTGNSS